MNYAVKKTLSIFLLMSVALVWGVAENENGVSLSSFTFISVCFLLAAAVLLPIIGLQAMFGTKRKTTAVTKTLWKGGIFCGIALAASAVLGQMGGTTAFGNRKFVFSLFILIVPIICMFFRKRASAPLWFGVLFALVGIFLLRVKGGFSLSNGDLYALGSGMLFAVQIVLADTYAPKVDGIKLACVQFFIGGIICLIPAIILEKPDFSLILAAYSSVLRVALAFVALGCTLQIIAQKNVSPSLTALLLALQSVFAALAGLLLYQKALSTTDIIGITLVFIAIILAQINPKKEK